MYPYIILVFVFGLVRSCDCLTYSYSGTITNDTHFFYRTFQTYPSRSANFYYEVSFPLQTEYVNLFFYTTKDHVNIDKNCSVRDYAQVKYSNMHQKFDRYHKACPDSRYRVICKQSRPIQDYKPRHFAFSFGFDCKDKSSKSLKGLTYHIRIYDQTNKTTCSTMPNNIPYCTKFYNQVSHPNLIGHAVKEEAAIVFHTLFPTQFNLNNVFNCYPYFLKVACYTFFPRCNATSNSFIVPCRDTWEQLSEACFPEPQSANSIDKLLGSLFPAHGDDNFVFHLASVYFSSIYFDYEYLPLRGHSPCYYEDVTCESPPNVTRAEIEGLNENGSYIGGSEVNYTCTDQSKHIVGNSTVRCLYGGIWSDPPVCKDRQSSNNVLKILLPTLVAVTLCLLVVVIVVYVHKKERVA